ncbi:tetratricopeptide repeat protein [Afifella pfennigii]|uniref:tetratricopeptide repeat protein n=1 Tax=Afifella pfennigii TaxID=209897 RepID=UPI000A8B972B|nr:tetratricopeptide repeat protein [Afifella pfennigii]
MREEQRFRIVIVDLRHDGDGRQTAHLEAALRSYPGLDSQPVGPILEWGFGNHSERKTRAGKLLKAEDGDVLIFGEVAKADERLRLNILGNHAGAEGRHSSYELQKADLPSDFNKDFDAALVALVLAQVAPATERAGQDLAGLLRPVAEKLRHLCENMPASLDVDQRGGLWHALGLAQAVVGEQTGDSAWLVGAATAFQKTSEEFTRERVPLDWATTQNNLGNALQALGERESGTARLDEAIDAYRAALGEFTHERVPLGWAMTQNNLGTALLRLGERESGTERLEEAVTAFRAALEEFTRERVPLDWAMTQNNLGNALQALGERESGTARLDEAIAAYHAALKEWTRERVPLQWATTQNNLGNALRTLGERERGTARLEAAVAAYEGALEVLREAHASFYIKGTERNLARAKALLAERRAPSEAGD